MVRERLTGWQEDAKPLDEDRTRPQQAEAGVSADGGFGGAVHPRFAKLGADQRGRETGRDQRARDGRDRQLAQSSNGGAAGGGRQ